LYFKYAVILNPEISFNIDKTCFLSNNSAYWNYIWRIMWHWRLE